MAQLSDGPHPRAPIAVLVAAALLFAVAGSPALAQSTPSPDPAVRAHPPKPDPAPVALAPRRALSGSQPVVPAVRVPAPSGTPASAAPSAPAQLTPASRPTARRRPAHRRAGAHRARTTAASAGPLVGRHGRPRQAALTGASQTLLAGARAAQAASLPATSADDALARGALALLALAVAAAALLNQLTRLRPPGTRGLQP